MHDAIIIKYGNYQFLLPERGFSYFPSAFVERIEHIDLMISAYERLMNALNNPFSAESMAASSAVKSLRNSLADFVLQTGIIGEPFDLIDVRLYVVDRRINVKMTLEMPTKL